MKNLRGDKWWMPLDKKISLKECPFCGAKKINSRFYDCGLYVTISKDYVHLIHECQAVSHNETIIIYNKDIGI